MSNLKARLAALSKEDRDAELTKLWKQFADTPYCEALCLAIDEIREELLGAVMNPNATDSVRAHASGGLNSVTYLLKFIRAAVNFNAAEAINTPPDSFETDASDSFTPSSE